MSVMFNSSARRAVRANKLRPAIHVPCTQTAFFAASARCAASAPPPRTRQLASWSAGLRYEALPPAIVEKTKDFFLDWYGCTLGGRHHPAVAAINAFAQRMGPALSETGGSELLNAGGANRTSAAFAALVNGAASHVVEQDDLHNHSVVHPGTVVFPAALAVAQETKASGRDLIAASVAGYDVACRVGEFLGPSHYVHFHTTSTAGIFGATAAAANLLRLDAAQTLSALGTAGTQAAGLWQFLVDATHSKQVHTGKAGFDGVFSAYAAQAGLLGTGDVLEGESGLAAAMVPGDAHPEALTRNLASDYSIMQTSFKWHASCRHTHGSADGLLQIMQDHNLTINDIEHVVCHVYKAAIDVLGRTGVPETVHQSKFSMGFVLAVVAKYGRASVLDFTEAALYDPGLLDFQGRVDMVLDDAIEEVFPERWNARVVVTTKDGRTLEQFVEAAKGDPEKQLTRPELEEKARRIAEYAGIKNDAALDVAFARVWKLEDETDLMGLAIA